MHRPVPSRAAGAGQFEAFALLSDRMAARTNPWAIGTATVINGGIITLVFLLGMKAAIAHFSPPPAGAHVDISDFPIFVPHPAVNGGNGSGSHDLIDPTRGRTPPYSAAPLAPPMVPVIEQPRLAADATIAIQLPDDTSMPNIGVHNSTNVTRASNGPGGPSGIGTGRNGDYGPGNGPGWGPGIGDQVYVPGQSGLILPTLIYAPQAEFSDEARRNKYQGICIVGIIVDTHGNPQNLHVIRSLGMGLDEKAMEAIRKYRFKPGAKDGKPVPVAIAVRIDFNLF